MRLAKLNISQDKFHLIVFVFVHEIGINETFT